MDTLSSKNYIEGWGEESEKTIDIDAGFNEPSESDRLRCNGQNSCRQ